MILRPEQIEALNEESRSGFEERMVAHLQKCFPKHCKSLGNVGVLDSIKHGIKRAARYGIGSERSVCKYIDLMFMLGRDFDTDTRMPWAQEILNNKELDPDVKAQRLVLTTREQIRRLDAHTRAKGGRS